MTFHHEVFAPNRRESNQLTLRPTGFDPAPEKKKKIYACALKTESNINLELEFFDLIGCELLSINCAHDVIFHFFLFFLVTH